MSEQFISSHLYQLNKVSQGKERINSRAMLVETNHINFILNTD